MCMCFDLEKVSSVIYAGEAKKVLRRNVLHVSVLG